ncbi:hypothetical protein CBL_05970 [Carabus blaptoides fortunei]
MQKRERQTVLELVEDRENVEFCVRCTRNCISPAKREADASVSANKTPVEFSSWDLPVAINPSKSGPGTDRGSGEDSVQREIIFVQCVEISDIMAVEAGTGARNEVASSPKRGKFSQSGGI